MAKNNGLYEKSKEVFLEFMKGSPFDLECVLLYEDEKDKVVLGVEGIRFYAYNLKSKAAEKRFYEAVLSIKKNGATPGKETFCASGRYTSPDKKVIAFYLTYV